MTTGSRVSLRHVQTPIRDQGAHRPTCAAFAVTGAHEWMCGNGIDLSEEWCLWAADKLAPSVDGSTSVPLGLEGITRDGQAIEQHWPYGNPAWPAEPPNAAADARNRVTPGVWRKLGHPSFAEIRAVIERDEAVILSLRFIPFAWYYVGSDAVVDAPPGAVTVDGHAVLAVGMDQRHNGEVLEFKNSWGDSWGDHGYGYLADTYWTRYGKAAYALGRH